jgi:FSR family fosmidomycin resistance protein-like MFS transporter
VAHTAIELSNNYLPIVYPLFIASLGLSYTQVGLITLASSTGTALLQPLFGYLSDRWEPRRIIIASVVWIGLLMGMVGLTPTYGLLIALVGLGSLGSAAYHPAGASAAAAIPTRRKGASLSIFSVSGTLGAALSPLWAAAAIAWLGLRGTTLLVPFGLLLGLLLYMQPGWGGATSHSTPAGGRALARRDGSLLALILVTLAVMTRSWVQLSLTTYLPEWLQGQGWTMAGSGQMLTGLLIAISAGTLIGGVLSDRIGRWQVLALSLALLAPLPVFLVTATGLARITLVGLFGFLLGASFPATVLMAQEAWPRGVGLASALVIGLGWLPGGIGASFTGLVADRSSLSASLQLLAIPPVAGLACTLLYAAHRRAAARHEARGVGDSEPRP